MITPKVSVIIPFFNLGEFLEDAVNSVLSQSYTDYEVIIVNDGSTEQSSIDTLQNFENLKNPKVRVLTKSNEGLPATRNHGIENSNGEYICCLDADDMYSPDFLLRSVETIEKNNDFGFVTTWFQPFGDVSGPETMVQIKKDNNLFFVKNVPHVASLFRKSAWEKVRGYDESMKNGYEDWNFWLSILENGYDWDVIPEPLFMYRVRTNSMLRSIKDKETENYEYILKQHQALLKKSDTIGILKAARGIIFEYDLIIGDLNKRNTSLKSQAQESLLNKIKKVFR
jgi:glycosyltransferase involved in cell wall biosynthesis